MILSLLQYAGIQPFWAITPKEVGGGWSLTVQSVDARASPRQAWLTLSKDGMVKSDIIAAQGQIATLMVKPMFEINLSCLRALKIFVHERRYGAQGRTVIALG